MKAKEKALNYIKQQDGINRDTPTIIERAIDIAIAETKKKYAEKVFGAEMCEKEVIDQMNHLQQKYRKLLDRIEKKLIKIFKADQDIESIYLTKDQIKAHIKKLCEGERNGKL